MPDPTVTPEQIEQMEELARRAQRATEIAATLPEDLPVITKIVMSNDLESAERVERALISGEFEKPRYPGDPAKTPYDRAIWFVGSYARMDCALRWQEAGYATREHLLDLLPDLWPASDPDDTDPRFIDLWKEAFVRNGSKPVRDGKHLPKGSVLRVYRGQPDDAPIGCAWSLNERVAEKFAKGAWARAAVSGGSILVLDVPRSHVLGYLTGRGEAEVILDPGWISRVTS